MPFCSGPPRSAREGTAAARGPRDRDRDRSGRAARTRRRALAVATSSTSCDGALRRDAAENAWSILTDSSATGLERDRIGLVALLGVWLSARRQWNGGAPLRRAGARQPFLTYGILAALFLLFVWWGPFAQARRPLWLLVTAVLLPSAWRSSGPGRPRFPDAAQTSPSELLPARLRPGSRAAPRRPAPASSLPTSSSGARLRAEVSHRRGAHGGQGTRARVELVATHEVRY